MHLISHISQWKEKCAEKESWQSSSKAPEDSAEIFPYKEKENPLEVRGAVLVVNQESSDLVCQIPFLGIFFLITHRK